MSKIEIRIADLSDAIAISLLGRETFSETFAHLFHDRSDLQEYLLKTFSANKIESSLSKAENAFWIAFYDQQPAGYAKLKLNSPSEFVTGNKVCQLQKIYVLKEFHALKIGFKLQDLVLQKAINQKTEAIWLSVLDSNARAISFYIKNDFKITGQHDFRIGKEHFEFKVMSRQLL